jgi:hypothetical protein
VTELGVEAAVGIQVETKPYPLPLRNDRPYTAESERKRGGSLKSPRAVRCSAEKINMSVTSLLENVPTVVRPLN